MEIIYVKIIAVIYMQLMQLWKESLIKELRLVRVSTLDLCDTSASQAKPTGSRSLNWFVINPWKDDDEIMSISKSYLWTAECRIVWRKIIAVIYATYAVAKRKPEKKILACTCTTTLSTIIINSTYWVFLVVRYFLYMISSASLLFLKKVKNKEQSKN